jgi:transposase, IS6 family
MQAFRYRRFAALVTLRCVRWYSKYTISHRQLAERGAEVDPSTIWRLVQRHAPRLEKETRWYQGYSDLAWRVDETCIRVEGESKWLSRAIDREGRTIDFMLTDRRDSKVA